MKKYIAFAHYTYEYIPEVAGDSKVVSEPADHFADMWALRFLAVQVSGFPRDDGVRSRHGLAAVGSVTVGCKKETP